MKKFAENQTNVHKILAAWSNHIQRMPGCLSMQLKSSSFVCSSTKRGTEEKGRGRESGYSQVQKNLTIKK